LRKRFRGEFLMERRDDSLDDNVLKVWRELDSFFASANPALLESLEPGASIEQLKQVDESLDTPLPQQLRAHLSAHNGQATERTEAVEESESLFCSSDGFPLLLLSAEEIVTPSNADNWDVLCKTLVGTKKKAAARGPGRGKGGRGLGAQHESNRRGWKEFFLFASSEPLGAEESSVGIALVSDGVGTYSVVEVSLQHSTLDEAKIVADSISEWLEKEKKIMQAKKSSN
jgi:cell wall assembly regulator SMI1